MRSYLTSLAAIATSIPFIDAHGYVSGIVVGGKWHSGWNPSYQYSSTPPAVAGWTTTVTDNGFVTPADYAGPDIICHKGATAAPTSVAVVAGSTIGLEWTVWPDSHKGPVLDYLASCPGDDCTSVDKSALEFFKIDAGGYINSTGNGGSWASDQLIANNNTWTLTIPSNLKPGGYVLRHEIIALHSAGSTDGAQNYPQCINLKVTGSGSVLPTDTVKGTALYKATDPGILINIYQTLTSYTIPGPAIPSALKAAAKRGMAFVA